jgi:glucose/arabinose dehydrogenase
VFAVAGASAGVAEVLSSHHGPAPGNGNAASPASPSAQVSSSAGASSGPLQPVRIANGPWKAQLINHTKRQLFLPGSLVAGQGSLYAITDKFLVRIDPGTGRIAEQVPYTSSLLNPPVVTRGTVWVVNAYSGGNVELRGYDTRTLAQVASVSVPALGAVSDAAQGVLAAGPDGNLYVAAGRNIAVVNPSTHQVTRPVTLSAGPAVSVAVSPDGRKIYVSVGSLHLVTYDRATGRQVGSSSLPGLTSTAANLVATSGGVWGTAGVGMSQWTWFAPDGDLTRMIRVTEGAGAGADSIPVATAATAGVVWIGGTQSLMCANPDTGQVMASAKIPADNGALEHFGSIVVTGGRAYSLYLDQAGRVAGVARLSPPSACGAWYAYAPR